MRSSLAKMQKVILQCFMHCWPACRVGMQQTSQKLGSTAVVLSAWDQLCKGVQSSTAWDGMTSIKLLCLQQTELLVTDLHPGQGTAADGEQQVMLTHARY